MASRTGKSVPPHCGGEKRKLNWRKAWWKDRQPWCWRGCGGTETPILCCGARIKWWGRFGGQVGIGYKVKQTQTWWLSHFSARYLPQRKENVRLRKDLYRNIHCSVIHNGPPWWGDHPHRHHQPEEGWSDGDTSTRWKVPSRNKKERITDTGNNMHESHRNFAGWKKPTQKSIHWRTAFYAILAQT